MVKGVSINCKLFFAAHLPLHFHTIYNDNQEGEDYRFVYNSSNGRLFWDADGEGDYAPQPIATFNNSPDLSFSDFSIA